MLCCKWFLSSFQKDCRDSWVKILKRKTSHMTIKLYGRLGIFPIVKLKKGKKKHKFLLGRIFYVCFDMKFNSMLFSMSFCESFFIDRTKNVCHVCWILLKSFRVFLTFESFANFWKALKAQKIAMIIQMKTLKAIYKWFRRLKSFSQSDSNHRSSDNLVF